MLAVSSNRGRKRVPTLSNTEPRVRGCFGFFPSLTFPLQAGHYRMRTRERDAHTCLITGVSPFEPARLKAAHIFPRSFDREWINKGFHELITDIAPSASLGGHLKIDSVQNVLLLRSDLHDAWDAYEIGVNVAVISSVLAQVDSQPDFILGFTGWLQSDRVHGWKRRHPRLHSPTWPHR